MRIAKEKEKKRPPRVSLFAFSAFIAAGGKKREGEQDLK